MALQHKLGGMGALARARTYISTRGRKNIPASPIGGVARRELDQEIGQLAEILDRRLDRDGSYGQNVLLRYDGRDIAVVPASQGMCTVVTGHDFLAGDLVLDENTIIDLNALESGSIEVQAHMISFRHVDGRKIEIHTLDAAPTLQ